VGFNAQDCNNLFISISSNGEQIYFSSDRHEQGGNYEIYKSAPDGISNLQRLTFTNKNNYYAKESPDGSKVVWQSGDYNVESEIWIMDADGTNQLQLTNNSVHDGYPNFSPDGQSIVFEAWDDNVYPEIFVMDTDGSNRQQLTNFPGAYWQSAPVFNPSGSAIYFFKGFNADNHIAKMNLDGSNQIDITPPNSFGYMDLGMSFSPDGSQIAFSTTDNVGYNNGSDIVVADTTGENWNFISSSSNGEYFYFPVWSADGSKIYYSYNPSNGAKWSIYEMNTNGEMKTMISSCEPVGITEYENRNVIIYPNPVNNNLNIAWDGLFAAKIYDMHGRLIHQINSNAIDVSFLNPGLYLIFIENEKGEILARSKFIKQ
jgi:Tol biopolymer transport system component